MSNLTRTYKKKQPLFPNKALKTSNFSKISKDLKQILLKLQFSFSYFYFLQSVLKYIEDNQLKMRIKCSFVKRYVENEAPQYMKFLTN